MTKYLFKSLFIISYLILSVSCKKDDDKTITHPITSTFNSTPLSWHKDSSQAYVDNELALHTVGNDTKKRISVSCGADDLIEDWINTIEGDVFTLSEDPPNDIFLELKEDIGNLEKGGYISTSGTINVIKVRNNKVSLNFSADMRQLSTNKMHSISGTIEEITIK